MSVTEGEMNEFRLLSCHEAARVIYCHHLIPFSMHSSKNPANGKPPTGNIAVSRTISIQVALHLTGGQPRHILGNRRVLDLTSATSLIVGLRAQVSACTTHHSFGTSLRREKDAKICTKVPVSHVPRLNCSAQSSHIIRTLIKRYSLTSRD